VQDDRPTRCDCELVDHKSCAHRLGSPGCQPGPSKPELEVRLPSTNRRVLWATFTDPHSRIASAGRLHSAAPRKTQTQFAL